MGSLNVDDQPKATESASEAGETMRRFRAFGAWCLQREAFKKWNYLILVAPFLTASFLARNTLGSTWNVGQGSELFRILLETTLLLIFVFGIRYASNAVCWEVSRDLRDLVRLSGIEPGTLLWCQLLSRWWIIGLSVLLALPLALFARTLGGGTSDQWIAGICWLILWAFLISGFAAIASVSTSQSSNAETTAAWATFLLMMIYHLLFWGLSAAAWILFWLLDDTYSLPAGSLGRWFSDIVFNFAPATGLYRAIWSSSTFSPLEAPYWMHFVTGVLCLRMASIVMRNRFRVTSQGDRDQQEAVRAPIVAGRPKRLRPRCGDGDSPFFWKDAYILGSGDGSREQWKLISYFAIAGVIASVIYGFPLVSGMVAIIFTPCSVAIRFDSLLTAEFRGQTWASLMLLPVDPRIPLLAKVQAAAWERSPILLPVGLAALIACFTDFTLILMAIVLASIAGILMIEISILNQLNLKLWWPGPIVGVIVVGIIIFDSIAWINLDRVGGFVVSMVTSIVVAILFSIHIEWRLKNWSDG